MAEPLNPSHGGARTCLSTWFTRVPGAILAEEERRIVEQLLPRMFGYHIVQIGGTDSKPLYAASPISHRILAGVEEEGAGSPALRCATDNLPFLAESLDVVILPHTLEFSTTPHKLLRECERILIGEGHLIILGFNPWSLYGLWRLFLAWRGEPPWNGHFYRLARIKDWLSLLDLELVSTERCFFRPPLRRPRLLHRLGFVEKLGRYCWSYFGGVHIMVARKHVAPLMPLRPSWRDRRAVVSPGVAEPSARVNQEHA